jgi:hypothetical protein
MTKKHGPDTVLTIGNPYSDRCARWLKGEIHAHVNKDSSNTHYSDGVSAATIYTAAQKAGLDFVCMSVDVTLLHGGAGRYGHVGAGSVDGVIGIPGREIQNNYYSPEYLSGPFGLLDDNDYFSELGAAYLHVLTIGDTSGISICLHPRYYEIVKCKPGGCWTDIRSALLHPQSGGHLAQLDVSGIEIYNGFTLDRLQSKGKEYKYSGYDEFCWDELLTEQKLYWGFAGNDSFFHHSDTFDSFSPLGVTYAAVDEKISATAIVNALKRGRFYSSTGIELSDNPINVAVEGHNLRIDVSATIAVDWTARVLHRAQYGWNLDSQHILNTRQATFVVAPEWKYVRIRGKSVRHPWQMAWLQPITNREYFP